MSVMIVLDASASMDFPATGVSKFRYATVLAAALSYLIVTDGDRAGLMTSTGGALTYVPVRGGRLHLRTLLSQLERLTPAGVWKPAQSIARAADILKRRGLVIVISDFYDAEEETLRELKRVRRRGHDVAMLQIVSRPEIDFSYDGQIEFEDLESGGKQLVDATTATAGYRTAIGAFLAEWKRRARQDGIEYARFTTDQPPSDALRSYLVQRGSRPHGSHAATREFR